jgi:hypothetical protein
LFGDGERFDWPDRIEAWLLGDREALRLRSDTADFGIGDDVLLFCAETPLARGLGDDVFDFAEDIDLSSAFSFIANCDSLKVYLF